MLLGGKPGEDPAAMLVNVPGQLVVRGSTAAPGA
jgi:hypothetical protein